MVRKSRSSWFRDDTEADFATQSTPAIHRSMIITPPAKLVQCEPFAFAWEGGEGPFRAFISGKVPGGSNTWIRSSHGTVGNVSFARIEDFPIGTEVEISIAVRFRPQGGSMVTEDPGAAELLGGTISLRVPHGDLRTWKDLILVLLPFFF